MAKAEIIEYSEAIDKARNTNVVVDGPMWSATLKAPLGMVAMSGWDYGRDMSGVSYDAIVGGRLRTMYERGRARTPTGAARVAHRWLKDLMEEVSDG